MYVPSFLEIFLGWCAVVGWAAWLRPRIASGAAGFAVAAIPWATGIGVLAGQLWAMATLMQGPEALPLARSGSLGSAALLALALLTEAGLTAAWTLRQRG